MSTPARRRWAVVGCGSVGPAHAYSLDRSSHAELVAVVDAEPAARQPLADRYGTRAFPSLESLLTEERVDAISLALPTSLHEEAAATALQAGVSVLCEKPLAADSATARRMIEVAAASTGQLGAVLNYRGYLQLRAVKDAITAGVLHPLAASVDVSLRRGPDRGATALDRGIVLAVGVHYLDLLRWWLGEPLAIAAMTRQSPPSEDDAAAVLRFPEEVLASITLTRNASPTAPVSLRLETAEGRFLLEGFELSSLPAGEPVLELPPPEPPPPGLVYGFGHVRSLDEAARALAAGEPFPVPAEEGARAVALCEGWYRSASERCIVDNP